MVIKLPFKFQIDRKINERARVSALKILKISDFNLKNVSFTQKLIEIES